MTLQSLFLRFAVSFLAIFAGLLASVHCPAGGLLLRWTGHVAATVLVLAVLAAKSLHPMLGSWAPRLGDGVGLVGATMPWAPLRAAGTRGGRDLLSHVFALLLTAAAFGITILLLLTPPAGLS
jgi:hypothetical protein